MPNAEAHIDTIGGVKFIIVWGVHRPFRYTKGGYMFKELPFGFVNALWVFPRVTALTFANFRHKSGLLVHMDGVIDCS